LSDAPCNRLAMGLSIGQRNLPGLLDAVPHIGFNEIAMGNDYAFKWPLQNPPQRLPRRRLVAPSPLIFRRGLRAGVPMKERNLAYPSAASHQNLVELSVPAVRGGIAQ
jgi:hypothetical protein